jgi:DNA-binding HxlR family transcriptional regulator
LKISKILEIPSVKILLFIREKGEVRFTDLAKLIASRGALSANMKALEKEKLLNRRVVTSKPIQTHYSLTEKGQIIAKNFSEVREAVSDSEHYY